MKGSDPAPSPSSGHSSCHGNVLPQALAITSSSPCRPQMDPNGPCHFKRSVCSVAGTMPRRSSGLTSWPPRLLSGPDAPAALRGASMKTQHAALRIAFTGVPDAMCQKSRDIEEPFFCRHTGQGADHLSAVSLARGRAGGGPRSAPSTSGISKSSHAACSLGPSCR